MELRNLVSYFNKTKISAQTIIVSGVIFTKNSKNEIDVAWSYLIAYFHILNIYVENYRQQSDILPKT